MYSQGKEEEWVKSHFKGRIAAGKGSFLDIGAYDGKTFSNTHLLAENGWSGVCVEPSPSVFVQLMKLYKDNAKIQLVNSAVMQVSSMLCFHDSHGDAISTFSEDHRKLWADGAGVDYQPIHIKTITIGDIINTFGVEFEFINLDVEGVNTGIFLSLPFKLLTKLTALCVEKDKGKGSKDRIMEVARRHGFRCTQENAENLFLEKR